MDIVLREIPLRLVYGGLRYLQNGQFHVTYQSVREREQLLKELPYLIWPISFVLPYYNLKDQILFKMGLSLYDLFAGKKYHKNLTKEEVLNSFPFLRKEVIKKHKHYGLRGGYIYQVAQTDDVRLLIRTLKEAEKFGATILNYIDAKEELKYCLEEKWLLFYEDVFYRRFRFGMVKKEIQDLILNYLNNFVSS